MFIAVPVPAAVREELRRLQDELRGRLPGQAIRWTRPEQIHLTLRFLGNVPADSVGELTDAVRRACASFAPIPLHAGRIGFFPQARVPRVIWVWVHDDWGHLTRLQQAATSVTSMFTKEPEEKGFTGHLTIARAQGLKPAPARILGEAALEMTNRVFGDWTAESVEIKRSELSAGGSRYSTLAELPLGGNTGCQNSAMA